MPGNRERPGAVFTFRDRSDPALTPRSEQPSKQVKAFWGCLPGLGCGAVTSLQLFALRRQHRLHKIAVSQDPFVALDVHLPPAHRFDRPSAAVAADQSAPGQLRPPAQRQPLLVGSDTPSPSPLPRGGGAGLMRGCGLSRYCSGRSSIVLAADKAIDGRTDHAACNRCHPEQPKLRKGPIAHKHRNPGAAGRIDGCVCHRDGNQMDEG